MPVARFFRFQERQTNLRTEILAGLSTFITMAYILVVNPAILQKAGMDFEGVFVATILASVLGTLIMGVVANYPIAIAPGMGMNAYFTFVIVLGMKIPWPSALASVFVASLIFLLLSLTRLRQALINAIPPSLKASISAGIGLFIAFIGMQNAHLISASSATLVTLGDFSDPIAYLSLLGLLGSVILLVHRIRAAIFLGMLLSALLCVLLGKVNFPASFIELPSHATSTFLKLDFKSFTPDLAAVIFTFFLIMLFDTTATMIGIAGQAGLLQNGRFPNAKSALCADAIASTVGALAGTSPTSAYIESGAGVSVGGRTGFTCVVVALLFMSMLFFAPVAKMLASVPSISAPALIIVGFLMMSHLSDIDWHDVEEALPAFFVLFWIPLSYSITSGVGAGLILYPLLKIVRGKYKQVHPLLYVFMILFTLQFILDALHGAHA
ncbi:NCS2 family permease [Helicobacter vulpis]|uniref:NCS2 family permease n=1 Tax=Helicobacter vulpis TaxID=2316076 RepID=UPI000EB5C90E|nr:NCS2 family permease [Helicobacter vulpis]